MHSQQRSQARESRPSRRWPQLWAVVLIPPACLAALSMSVTMAAAAIVATFGLAMVTALAMTADSIRGVAIQLGPAVRFGTISTVTCLGFGGLFAYRGSLAWAAVALYAGTVAWACSSRPTLPEPSAGRVASVEELPVITADAVRSMTGAELCQAWRRSSAMLSAAHDPGQRVQVVALRQVILDSMDVRDPAGLREWLLHSGVRAAGDPD
jgi:hypothetical protein